MAICLAFLLRKGNVSFESAKAVYQGSGSLGTTLPSPPGLTYRFLAEVAVSLSESFANLIRRAFWR